MSCEIMRRQSRKWWSFKLILRPAPKYWYSTIYIDGIFMWKKKLVCWSTSLLNLRNRNLFYCQGAAELWQEIELIWPQACFTSFWIWWEPLPLSGFSFFNLFMFLAVQDSLIGDLVTHWLSDTPFDFSFFREHCRASVDNDYYNYNDYNDYNDQTWNLSKILHSQIFRLKVLHYFTLFDCRSKCLPMPTPMQCTLG